MRYNKSTVAGNRILMKKEVVMNMTFSMEVAVF